MTKANRPDLLAFLDTEVQRQDSRSRHIRALLAGLVGFLALIGPTAGRGVENLSNSQELGLLGLALLFFLKLLEPVLKLETRLVHPQASTTDLNAAVLADRIKLLAKTGPGRRARLSAGLDAIMRGLLAYLLVTADLNGILADLARFAGWCLVASALADIILAFQSGRLLAKPMSSFAGAAFRIASKSHPDLITSPARIKDLEKAGQLTEDFSQLSPEAQFKSFQWTGRLIKAVTLAVYVIAGLSMLVEIEPLVLVNEAAQLVEVAAILGFMLVGFTLIRLGIRLYGDSYGAWLEQVRFGVLAGNLPAKEALYLIQLFDFLRSTDYSSAMAIDELRVILKS